MWNGEFCPRHILFLFSIYSPFLYRTFNALSNKEKILQKLEDIALELEGDLKELGFTGRTVTLKYKLDTYQGNLLNQGLMLRSTDLHQSLPVRSLSTAASARKKRIYLQYVHVFLLMTSPDSHHHLRRSGKSYFFLSCHCQFG